jgi:hypothetical protein
MMAALAEGGAALAVIWNRINTVLLVLVLLALVAVSGMLATGVRGGPLDPPGPPGPTGKTLDEIPGSWSRVLPANDGAAGPFPPAGCDSSRFKCVFDNTGVLDLETGLVWERGITNGSVPWAAAESSCLGSFSGGRGGWRLPTYEELQSLVDPNASGPPYLPDGHPFLNASNEGFWTATTLSTDSAFARVLHLDLGGGVAPKLSGNAEDFRRYWCVRGAQGFNGM